MEFVHDSHRQRVRFASGAATQAVAEEAAALGGHRVMVIASDRERALAEQVTAGLPVTVWHNEVVMHVPTEVSERARSAAVAGEIDLIVSVGGGSTTGLAKAVALRDSPKAGTPILAVPTTYAGSEATNVWALTEGETKTTGVDDGVVPRTIVYDASLMMTLPLELSVASGLNALAHCIDSMWAPRTDPIDKALAGEGIRALASGLRAVVTDPQQLDGREQTLYGAYLGAVVFGSAGSGLHHKICHVLGGMFNLPHAETHAIVLPHVLAFNTPNAADAERRIAEAFRAAGGEPVGAQDGLRSLRADVDAPRALRDIGMPEAGIDKAVAAVLAAAPAGNPTPMNQENIHELLGGAWAGEEP